MRETKEYKCEYCCKVYKHKQSKYNHLLNCKEKMKLESRKSINYHNSNVNNIQNQQNATTINNQNIHIHINAGKENYESITDLDKINILNKVGEAFPEALKTIYRIPENRNFYLPNKREKKYVKVFDGDTGVYENSEEFKFKLSHIIINKLEEWFDKYNKKMKNKKENKLT